MSLQQSLYWKHRASQKQEVEKFDGPETSQLSPTQHPLNPALMQEPALNHGHITLITYMWQLWSDSPSPLLFSGEKHSSVGRVWL